MHAALSELASSAAEILARLRTRAPRVHCITNTVAQAYTANVLLAAGAAPSMTIAPEEIAAFVAGADALLVNLGTLDAERRAAIGIAVGKAAEKNIRWVLDPVFIDRAPARAEFARALMGGHPSIIRLNSAEFTSLAGGVPEPATLMRYARENRTVAGLTGAVDLVVDDARLAMVKNGHPYMAKVTAMGCAGSALVAACLAVESDPWRATVAGLIVLGVAGEIAGSNSRGPGSFAIAIIDALHALDRETLMTKARVT
jgi:hydroxyethylthiazole kinase